MTKPKKKPEPKPTPPAAIDKSETLAVPHDEKPIRIGSADATLPLCGICGRRAEVDLKPCPVDGFRFVRAE